ncbi:MAG: M48 family metallopeptidase [Bacteroidia bacterium]
MLIPLLLLTCLAGQQVPEQYRLRTQGPPPAAFQQGESERLASLRARQPDSSAAIRDWYYRTATQVTGFLHSGKVLYNDPVSRYLEKVMDSLLVAEPELRKNLQVFTILDGSPNASVTPDGLVLVNLGLLARVETEAELAFVLSHEMSHFARNHGLRRIAGQADRQLEDSPLANDLYNQAQEREADQAGFTRLLRSRYSPRAALDVFASLSGSFPSRALDLAWLAPQGAALPICGGASAEQDLPSTLGSHPLPESRRNALFMLAGQTDTTGTSHFLVGKSQFFHYRLAARYYITRLALQERRYEEAITLAYNLWREDPGQRFSMQVATRALYGLSAYADAGRLYEVHFPPKQQSMARLSCLIERLKPRELNAFAMQRFWQLYREGDSSALVWMRDLAKKLGGNHRATPEVLAPPNSLAASWLAAPFSDSSIMEEMKQYTRMGWEKDSVSATDQVYHKIVLVAPEYQHIDARKNRYPSLEKGELRRKAFLHNLDVQLHKLGFETIRLQSADDDQYQQFIWLQQWEKEKRLHGSVPVLVSQQEFQQVLREAYQTPLFLWAGLVAETDSKKNKLLRLVAGLPILPYTIVSTCSPKHHTVLYTLSYRLDTGEAFVHGSKAIPRADRHDVVSAALFDLLIQLPH